MILPLEKQLVSLPLAQKMKELGFEQESLFYWSDWFKPEEYSLGYQASPSLVRHTQPDGSYTDREPDLVSAYTVAELGEMLPDGYFAYRRGSSWFTGKDLHQIAVAVASDTEANAKATLAIYLKENNLL